MPELSLSLLGPFQAWTANGIPRPFRTLKERALLSYLVVENDRSHRRETLADLFWPDRLEGIARNSLRQALYGLRQGIGEAGFDAIFKVTTDEVWANPGEQIWLDLVAFEIHLKAVQQHNHTPGAPCAYCLQHLRDAAEIYRGNFLEDVTLEKNQEFEEWAALRREQYARLHLQALNALVGEYERMGNYLQAAAYARRQITYDGLDEALYCRLMTLLARAGQISAALEEYENCRRKLSEALGRDVDKNTAMLAAQIRESRFEAGPSISRAITNNLPEQLTPFIGREMELSQITDALESPASRLISLVGLGGVGKTRLAIQAARLNLRLFPDGVFFISLDSLPSAGRLTELIGLVIGLVPGAQQEMSNLLIEYLRPRHILFVLDDFDHRLGGKEQLLEVLQQAPSVKILLTSRERLRFQAEYLVELNGLPFPAIEPEPENFQKIKAQALRSDAIRLLFERASRVRSGSIGGRKFVSGPAGENDSLLPADDHQDLESALRICQLVDGLPLGIELAASWARDYTFAQIAEEVQLNLEFLQNTFEDLPERHRSLRASFEHSWDLLSESEREVFSKLAVFPGSFSGKAAQDVAGAAQPWLVQLEDKSLVRVDTSYPRAAFGRYALHPLLKQYARQKLHQYSRRIEDLARRQHAQFFCAFLKERELGLKGFCQAEALGEVEAELDNIHAAWDWAVEHKAFDFIEQACFGMLFFLEARSRWREGEALFRGALYSLQNSSANGSADRILACLSAGLGWFCCRLTRFQEAEELLQNSLRILDEQEEDFIRIFAHFALGWLYTWMSRFPDAWLHLTTCLSIAEHAGDGWGIAWSREILAEIAFESGKTGFIETPFIETLALFERAGELRGSSRALNYLGNIALTQERYGEARAYFEKLLATSEKLGDVWGAAGGYSKLGQLSAAQGAYEQAWRLHQKSLAMLQKMGDQRRTAYTMRELGEVAAALGRRAEAEGFFQQALEIAAGAQSTPLIQDILTGIAAVMFRGAQKELAAELLSLVFSEPIGDKLTANRAARLHQAMQERLPAEQLERARARSSQTTLQNAAGQLLFAGIKL